MKVSQLDYRALSSEYYGDKFRWFIGTVVSINDPLKIGRVKVRIYGVHSEDLNLIKEADLPWCQTIIPPTEDGVPGLGRTVGIKQGAQVVGFFADGKMSQIPIIMGSLITYGKPTPGQQGRGLDFPSSSFDPNVNSPANQAVVTDGVNPSKSGGALYSDRGAVGGSNVEKAFNFFVSTQLFSPVQSAAICGNLIKESGMNPTIVSGFSGENSFGIAQWNPAAGRKQQLVQWASDNKLDFNKLETQLQFLVYDFTELSPRFYKYSKFVASNDLQICTEIFCNGYERPSAAAADIPGRVKFAQETFSAYARS